MKKQNKKTISWLSIPRVIILAVVIIFVLSGCSGKNQLKLAQESIDNALAFAISDLDNPELMTEYFSVMKEKSNYDILKVEEKGGMTVAYVKVQSPDLYSIAKKLDASYSKYPSTEEMDRIITAELNNAQIITTELEVMLLENKNGYTALLTDEFANAYYGNILKLQQDYLSYLWEEIDK